MKEQRGSLDVAQESETQACTPMGPRDDARDVCDHDLPMVAHRDHSQVRNERGERVIRYFRTECRNFGDERGFSRVGVADDAHLRDQFQFQAEPPGFTLLAGIGAPGRLVGGGSEAGISPSSCPPPGGNKCFTVLGKILEKVAGFAIPNDRPQREREDEVRGTAPLLVFSFSVLASFGEVMLAVMKIKEGGKLAVGSQNYFPAFSPVAAIRSSPGNVFFAAKADATVFSVSGLDEDFSFIDKFDRLNSPSFPRTQKGAAKECPQA